MRLYKETFTGTEAVNWIMKYFAYQTRSQAIDFTQLLITEKLIARVSGRSSSYVDSGSTHFRFVDKNPREKKN